VPGRRVYVEGPRNDVFTFLLGIALACVLIACILLALVMQSYEWKTNAGRRVIRNSTLARITSERTAHYAGSSLG